MSRLPFARTGLIRLVHLSDVHFGCENAAAVEAAITAVHDFAPTLTIVSGDFTADGQWSEFKAARAWLDRLPHPQIATPGNHDVPYWNVPLRLLSPFKRYSLGIGSPQETAAYLSGLTVRCINTARGAQPRLDWSKGAISLAAVAKAAAEMRLATAALKVLVCHHPLIEMQKVAVSGGVHRGAAAASLLAESGVDLILSGHVHNPFVFTLPFVDERSYAVGAGTLSLRTRGTPPSFSTIEADAATITVSRRDWTGAAFGTGAVWTLPRRQPDEAPATAIATPHDQSFQGSSRTLKGQPS